MHEPVRANIEDYLAGSDSLPRNFMDHLGACDTCRRELAELEAQSALLRALKTVEEIEPRAGFYARVIDRVERERQSSFWSVFLEPAFGRRLAVASAVLAVLMGFYLVSSEPAGAHFASRMPEGPVVILPGEDQPGQPILGAEREQDRGTILVDLASYREQ